LDGSLAAATVVNRKRAVLFNALDYAVEEGLLPANPLPTLKWTTPRKATVEIDRRSVVSPAQARTLLNAIRETKRSGRQLYACFSCSYFAALRPEEAVNLRRADIFLPAAVRNPCQKQHEPANDWGELSLRRTVPHAGREWTNSGRARDSRGSSIGPRGRSASCRFR
jgi:integrase